jgi:hypothetical protein
MLVKKAGLRRDLLEAKSGHTTLLITESALVTMSCSACACRSLLSKVRFSFQFALRVECGTNMSKFPVFNASTAVWYSLTQVFGYKFALFAEPKAAAPG